MNKVLFIAALFAGLLLGRKFAYMEKVKALIKRFEGERLTAYKDAAGYWTIGIGHLIKSNEQNLIGATITADQSDTLFKMDLKIATDAIDDLVKVKLTPEQYAALASFIFNVGVGNFSKSTLLKKLNAGDYAGASAEFLKWNKAGGKELPGLTTRRTAEMTLFKSVGVV